MVKEMEAFPQLKVTPPLRLKDLGTQDPCLVFLREGKKPWKAKIHEEKLVFGGILLKKTLNKQNKPREFNHINTEIGIKLPNCRYISFLLY